jgi:hypothetical protein
MKRKTMTDDGPERVDSFEFATKLVRLSMYVNDYSVERLDGNGVRITLGGTVVETDPETSGYVLKAGIPNKVKKDLGMKKSDQLPLFDELTDAMEIGELAHEHTLYPKDPAAYGNLLGVMSRYLARKAPDGNVTGVSEPGETNFYR